MTKAQFEIFAQFRQKYRDYCESLSEDFGSILRPLQIEAAKEDTPPYPLETPVVYNSALDDVSQSSEIRLIVVGDNPGKAEQRTENRRYLVGQSGKIAANFFARNAEFGIDFRKNAVILNKTPIHTAKTKHLKKIAAKSEKVRAIIEESQKWLAKESALLHRSLVDLEMPLEFWLVGYAELKKNGIFEQYRIALKENSSARSWQNVRVFQHFSMNCFLNDLRKFQSQNPQYSILEAAKELGVFHRNEIFGSF